MGSNHRSMMGGRVLVRRRAWGLAVLVVMASVVVACGTSSGDDAEKSRLKERVAQLEDQATSTTATEATSTPLRSTTTSAPTTTLAPITTAPTTTAAPPTTKPAAPKNLMPNVVCMNLQDAQDYIQATTDVFYSRSVDATGADRMQVIDSNWIVVSQTPAPGTPIGEGDAVLSVVKLDEPNDC